MPKCLPSIGQTNTRTHKTNNTLNQGFSTFFKACTHSGGYLSQTVPPGWGGEGGPLATSWQMREGGPPAASRLGQGVLVLLLLLPWAAVPATMHCLPPPHTAAAHHHHLPPPQARSGSQLQAACASSREQQHVVIAAASQVPPLLRATATYPLGSSQVIPLVCIPPCWQPLF